eukprot:g351.t1
MNATTSEIEKGFFEYSKDEESRRPNNKSISFDTWNEMLGSKLYDLNVQYTDYEDFFKAELKGGDVRSVMSKYLPRLLVGLGGGALHGVISVGFRGIESGSINQLAAGMAQLAVGWCVFPILQVERVQHIFHNHHQLQNILETMRMDQRIPSFTMSSHSNFKLNVANLVISDKIIEAVSDYAVNFEIESVHDVNEAIKSLYYLSFKLFNLGDCRSFFLLHQINAVRSLELILPFTDFASSKKAFEALWKNMLYYYIAVGMPSFNSHKVPVIARKLQSITEKEWSLLYQRAINARNDVHLNMVIYIAHLAEKKTGDSYFFHSVATEFLKQFEEKENNYCFGPVASQPPLARKEELYFVKGRPDGLGLGRSTTDRDEKICFSNFL